MSPTQGDSLGKTNESPSEKQIQPPAKPTEKKSLHVVKRAAAENEQPKDDKEFENFLKALHNKYYGVSRQLQHAAKRNVDNQTKMQVLRDKNSSLAKNLDELKAEAARLNNSHQQVWDKYKLLEKQHDEVRRSAIQALDTAKIHHANKIPSISVETINKKWRRLIYVIHDFVVQNLTVTPVDNGSSEDRDVIRQIISIVKEKPELQTSILERYIWKRLDRAVFRADSRLWGGDMGIAFAETCGDRGVHNGLSVAEVMKSRAAEIRISRLGVSKHHRVFYIQDFGKDLAPFKKSSNSDALHKGLALVLDIAINIMKMFITSQDIYEFGSCFEVPLGGIIVYDQTIMDISSCITTPDSPSMDQPGKFVVKFVQSPPLFVTSTTEGECFGRKQLVCPAFVTVSMEGVAKDDTEKKKGPVKDAAFHKASNKVVS
ncbi:hypothetical protein X797_001980 [Metarhizium robertsii]|uniref:Uncharacterized protein n=2 Tax=Metarhizium robertsii TaxID=568076 RepID=A0A0B2XFV0_METRA|nr:uncharacterized protein MAA_10817 [Metarhizium robertsii ARSEF 23]EXV04308.1 hypothetical protein X797_001980 [Metarhizium robertsii]KHO11575.1 hypothetical protein MAA_10817 [Metarhizium robertsii ARSEF 23]